MCCASRATAARTNCSSRSWRPVVRPTRCCPRKGRTPLERLGARRVWIVDPLDGTREFGELDRPDWAVHVALVIDGFPVAGAVALPALGRGLVDRLRPAAAARAAVLAAAPGRRGWR